MSQVLRYLVVSLRTLIVMTLLLGVAYPLTIWVVAQGAFRSQANGSLIELGGQAIGSSLIGQSFEGPEWFHPRPSAAGDGYDALASGASNLAPSSLELLGEVESRREDAALANGVGPEDIPPDALTASASGLDPHISPEYAQLQASRVAQARGLDPAAVEALVAEHTEGPTLGFLGASRVNVLELNLALNLLDGSLRE